MTLQKNQVGKAVIYCRVSSTRQKNEGSGLESQEHRCRQYAAAQGYDFEAVFPDDVSGGGDFIKRPGMVALLSYLDAQPDKHYIVIFDDLKRFARDTEFHIKLRREFQTRGAQIVDASSPSVITAYEGRIGKLERERLLLRERAAKTLPPKGRFEELSNYRSIFGQSLGIYTKMAICCLRKQCSDWHLLSPCDTRGKAVIEL